MANTYTWTIRSLDTKNIPQANTVYNINFTVTATDGNTTVSWDSENALEYDDNSSFVAYNSLTQTQVIGWLQDTIGEVGVNAIQSHMDYLLGHATITNRNAVPWA
jgi:hypothetical protein